LRGARGRLDAATTALRDARHAALVAQYEGARADVTHAALEASIAPTLKRLVALDAQMVACAEEVIGALEQHVFDHALARNLGKQLGRDEGELPRRLDPHDARYYVGRAIARARRAAWSKLHPLFVNPGIGGPDGLGGTWFVPIPELNYDARMPVQTGEVSGPLPKPLTHADMVALGPGVPWVLGLPDGGDAE
jgi:hypothetical protein